eukprot:GHVS01016007.1.p1 GENE.GHVS01016007.1~~GHVS01016007.1.p1  ORF type:complete len:180 (+),score=48.26 GHVS01016007.1:178-717(+)
MAAVAECCNTTAHKAGGPAEGNRHARDLTIRQSVVKRLVNELKFYREEEILNKQKIESIKTNRQHVSPSGEDLTGELKRYTAVLNDTQQMLPDAQKRLVAACAKLRRTMKLFEGDDEAAVVVVIGEAKLTLNSVSGEFPDIGLQIEGDDAGGEGDKQLEENNTSGDKQNKTEEQEEEEI